MQGYVIKINRGHKMSNYSKWKSFYLTKYLSHLIFINISYIIHANENINKANPVPFDFQRIFLQHKFASITMVMTGASQSICLHAARGEIKLILWIYYQLIWKFMK